MGGLQTPSVMEEQEIVHQMQQWAQGQRLSRENFVFHIFLPRNFDVQKINRCSKKVLELPSFLLSIFPSFLPSFFHLSFLPYSFLCSFLPSFPSFMSPSLPSFLPPFFLFPLLPPSFSYSPSLSSFPSLLLLPLSLPSILLLFSNWFRLGRTRDVDLDPALDCLHPLLWGALLSSC